MTLGGPGAGRRHPGGRRHGRNRKHAPQPRACESRCSAPCSTARSRSPFRRLSPRCRSASCSCPVLLLTGTARYLFTPLAMAVVFAMLASYLLSRTLVPTMVAFLLKSEVHLYQQGTHGETAGGKGVFWRAHYVFNRLFEASASATWACSIGRCGIAGASSRRSWEFPSPRSGWSGWSARISSPTWIPARCGCMRAVRPARASKKPR